MISLNEEIQNSGVQQDKTWNSSREYIWIHITLPFMKIQTYREMCLWGTSGLDEEAFLDINKKNENRIIGLRRFIETLKGMCRDNYFAVSKKNKSAGNFLQEKIKEIDYLKENLYPKIYTTKKDTRDGKVVVNIHEQKFQELYEQIEKISEDIRTPLNNSDLIFGSKDEEDDWSEVEKQLSSE